MSLNLDEILNCVDTLPIYSRDYEIILDLLNYTEPKLFAKIIECVINGELYWSDFEKILTDVSDIVDENLAVQEKIINEIAILNSLRSNTFYGNVTESQKIAILNSHEKYDEFEDTERKNFVNAILKITPEDSELSKLCKIKLFNSIENYENNLAKENPEITNDISPDDLFFSIGKYAIPLDKRYQVLNETDKLFMKENNLTEDQMKSYKSVKLFLLEDRKVSRE